MGPEDQREYTRQRENAAREVPTYRSLVFRWCSQLLTPATATQASRWPMVSRGQVGIGYVGHSSFLCRFEGIDVLLDPMLGHFVKGVKRAARPGVGLDALKSAGLILISHDHPDHLHRKTLSKLNRSATIVVPPGAAKKLSRLGFACVIELSPNQQLPLPSLTVTSIALRHGPPTTLGYLLSGNGPSVFFCGDSGYFEGFEQVGRAFRPDVALLPIGGYAPASLRAQHLTPLDALYAFEDLGAGIMIPHHYGTFPLSYERLEDPLQWLGELVRARHLERRVLALPPGGFTFGGTPNQQRARS